MSHGVILIMLLSVLLLGCSVNCDSAAIAGRYRIAQNSHVYELNLRTSGSGDLRQDNSLVGPLTWEMEVSTGQVLLNVRNEVLDILGQLAAAAPPPLGTVEARKAYFAISPQCTWSGRAIRLDLDEDGMRSFERKR